MSNRKKSAKRKVVPGKKSAGKAEAFLSKAMASLQSGKLDDALSFARRAHKYNSRDIQILNLLGVLELQAGNFRAAASTLETATGLFPDSPELHENLGDALVADGAYEKAARSYEVVTRLQSQNFRVWANLGNARLETGDAEGASAAYRRALEIDPESIPVLSNLAVILGGMGETEEALAFGQRALNLSPGDAEIYHDLSKFKKFALGDTDLLAMEKLKNMDLSADQRMYLGFALSKAYEDMADYDQAFDEMVIANQLKRAEVGFSQKRETELIEQIKDVFDAELINVDVREETSLQTPIFILGMPRSGTSLVEQILASHGDVYGAGELRLLRDVVTGQGGLGQGLGDLSSNNEPFPNGVSGLSVEDLNALGTRYLENLPEAAKNFTCVTDKMPRNFFFLGLIRLILPHAKVIHCQRSPLDTCLSCFSIHFPYGQEFSYDLTELGEYYQGYDALMSHWRSVLGDWFLDIRYEDLIAEPETEARKLIEFCDLPWEDTCLEFHKTKRHVRTASTAQVKKPIYKTAVQRWRHFETHLKPLIDALGPLADT